VKPKGAAIPRALERLVLPGHEMANQRLSKKEVFENRK
jgi:hypothetical protein